MFDRVKELKASVQHTVHKYKKWEPFVFFIAGFSFDALLLHRIDDPLMLTHQAIYLTLSALIIAWDLFVEVGKGAVPNWFNKVWRYREGVLHFLLGTLLNVYTIFYFKSGSFMSSLSFLILLALLLFVNEVRPAGIPKTFLRNSLFALCLISYMNIVVSILVGSIGVLVFFLAIAVAYLIHSLFISFLKKRLEAQHIRRDIRMPFVGVAILYVMLYMFKVLPPVPLSVKYIGIYHQVKRDNGVYKLGYTRPKWHFWQHGDETFVARPGDKIHCFVQIFSPSRFKENLKLRWQFKDPQRGWEDRDSIPLPVSGGREEGYRGYTTKGNYQPGEWRVFIETQDDREVGRIGFDVVAAEDLSEEVVMNFDER